jgi:ATP-dependent Lhr-like helicase
LLDRHGILTREAVLGEGIAGGFSAVYDVLKAMEESGRVRRGYFVAGLGAAQFALPGADDRLRFYRDASDEPRTLVLSASDPASPWGASVRWPGDGSGEEDGASDGRSGLKPKRAAGARVILHDGKLLGWMGRSERGLLTFLPRAEPERTEAIRAIVGALSALVDEGRVRAVMLATVDGEPTAKSPLAEALRKAGFTATSQGYLKRQAAIAPRAGAGGGRGADGWGRPWAKGAGERAAAQPWWRGGPVDAAPAMAGQGGAAAPAVVEVEEVEFDPDELDDELEG